MFCLFVCLLFRAQQKLEIWKFWPFFLKKILYWPIGTSKWSQIAFPASVKKFCTFYKIYVCCFVCLFVCYLGLSRNAENGCFGGCFGHKNRYTGTFRIWFFQLHLRFFRSFDWSRPFFRILTFVALDKTTFSSTIIDLLIFRIPKLCGDAFDENQPTLEIPAENHIQYFTSDAIG